MTCGQKHLEESEMYKSEAGQKKLAERRQEIMDGIARRKKEAYRPHPNMSVRLGIRTV